MMIEIKKTTDNSKIEEYDSMRAIDDNFGNEN